LATTFALRYHHVAASALMLATLADILTTVAGLRSGLSELNPLMAAILSHSELLMYGLKLLLVGLVLGLCLHIEGRYPLAWYVVSFWALITFLVAYSNYAQVVYAG